jgi:hypothetical protein
VAYAAVVGTAVFIVLFIKGEKPHWRWGDDEKSQSRSVADRLAELEESRRRQLISEPEYQARRQEILRDA